VLMCAACPCAFMLQASLFELLLNIALPVCPCMYSSRHPTWLLLSSPQQQYQVSHACACDGACGKPAKTSIPCRCVWSSCETPCSSILGCLEHCMHHHHLQHARYQYHACVLKNISSSIQGSREPQEAAAYMPPLTPQLCLTLCCLPCPLLHVTCMAPAWVSTIPQGQVSHAYGSCAGACGKLVNTSSHLSAAYEIATISHVKLLGPQS
jgi:hypothetical protein